MFSSLNSISGLKLAKSNKNQVNTTNKIVKIYNNKNNRHNNIGINIKFENDYTHFWIKIILSYGKRAHDTK